MKHDMLGLKELIRLNVRTYADMSSVRDLADLRSAFLKATDMVFDDMEEDLETFGSPSKKKSTIEAKREGRPQSYNKWTPEEEAELANHYQQGLKVSEIAALLGRNSGGIRARLKKLGLCQ